MKEQAKKVQKEKEEEVEVVKMLARMMSGGTDARAKWGK